MNKNLLKLVLISSIIFLMVGCDSKETVADIDKKAVERWNALIASDYEKAYSYMAPSHRQLEEFSVYRNRIATAQQRISWDAVAFKGKQCDSDTCEVSVDITHTYQFPKRSMGEVTGTTEVKENWIKSDDRWYYLPSEKKGI